MTNCISFTVLERGQSQGAITGNRHRNPRLNAFRKSVGQQALIARVESGLHQPIHTPVRLELDFYDSVKPRRLLVPFAGSGSEIIGAMLAGWDEIVGIEQDKEHGYVPIAEARLDWWQWAANESHSTDVMAILTRFGLVDPEPTRAEEQPSLFNSATTERN